LALRDGRGDRILDAALVEPSAPAFLPIGRRYTLRDSLNSRLTRLAVQAVFFK